MPAAGARRQRASPPGVGGLDAANRASVRTALTKVLSQGSTHRKAEKDGLALCPEGKYFGVQVLDLTAAGGPQKQREVGECGAWFINSQRPE